LPIAVLVIAFVIGGVVVSQWRSSAGRSESTVVSSPPPPEEKPLRSDTPTAAAPVIDERPTMAKPVPTKPKNSPVPPPASTSSRPILASAQLCSALSTANVSGDWKCTPPKRPADAGPLSFYTRLKSSRDTSVKHLWYRDGQLYQSVDLEIGANLNNGYRTYSRYRMSGESSGHWRVEVRAADGTLLHEERFDVR
jgi:hypothetical protein